MVSPSGNSSVGVGIVGGDSSVGSELGRGKGAGDGDGVGIIGSGNWVGGIVCAFAIGIVIALNAIAISPTQQP